MAVGNKDVQQEMPGAILVGSELEIGHQLVQEAIKAVESQFEQLEGVLADNLGSIGSQSNIDELHQRLQAMSSSRTVDMLHGGDESAAKGILSETEEHFADLESLSSAQHYTAGIRITCALRRPVAKAGVQVVATFKTGFNCGILFIKLDDAHRHAQGLRLQVSPSFASEIQELATHCVKHCDVQGLLLGLAVHSIAAQARSEAFTNLTSENNHVACNCYAPHGASTGRLIRLEFANMGLAFDLVWQISIDSSAHAHQRLVLAPLYTSAAGETQNAHCMQRLQRVFPSMCRLLGPESSMRAIIDQLLAE